MAAKQRKAARGAGQQSSVLLDLQHAVFDKVVFSKVRERFGGRLKYAFCGGAAISREVAEFIDNLGITVYEGYGLTETSPHRHRELPGPPARSARSARPSPACASRSTRAATGDAEQGEIVVYGHNVMMGYYNLPEENAKVFTGDGGFRTGDMGYLDDDGFLYITGRIKEQYKLENGKYVVPVPIEQALQALARHRQRDDARRRTSPSTWRSSSRTWRR